MTCMGAGVDRDQFFAELDQLTAAEIEAMLPSWDMEKLLLAQEYIAQKATQEGKEPETAQPKGGTNDEAVQVSEKVARRALTAAMMALIFSVGAMLAAIAAAVLAFLALRGATISW
jgi:hypothetical protein